MTNPDNGSPRKWYVTEDSLQDCFEQPEEMELEEA
jgi:hypothetical protein